MILAGGVSDFANAARYNGVFPRPGEHSQAKALDGTPLRFQITEMTIDAARHRARVRVIPMYGWPDLRKLKDELSRLTTL